MVDNAPPSRNPANDDSMTGMFREILKKSLQNTDDMLPAIVEFYDRETNRARVRPLIQMVSTNNNRIPRAEVASIPVLLIGGGDFFLSFNLPQGSLGWIKSSDRDISLFLQSYSESTPNTRRLHSFEDAIFIPDVMRGYNIDAGDAESCVLQNLDGTVKITLNNDGIRIVGPQVQIETGSSLITSEDGLVTLETDKTVMTGDLEVGGDVSSAGTVSADTDVTTGAISLLSHIHVAPSGGGNTTPPQ